MLFFKYVIKLFFKSLLLYFLTLNLSNEHNYVSRLASCCCYISLVFCHWKILLQCLSDDWKGNG